MDFTKRTIFKIFAKKRAASKGRSPILPLLGAGGFSLHAFNRVQFDTFRSEAGSASYFSPQIFRACIPLVRVPKLRFSSKYSGLLRFPQGLEILGDPVVNHCVQRRTSRRTPSSRANSSYMYQNYVLVVNTRSSSALPNRRLPSCRGPRGKFNCVADHIQHHKFSTSTPSWSFCHRLDPSETRS